MPYTFNKDLPPLMKNGEILDIDPSALQQVVATSTPPDQYWQTDNPPDHDQYHRYYAITRYQRWVMVQEPSHFATDTNVAITEVSGYDQTEKDAMEANLKSTAGGSVFGLSASIEADLKLSSEDVKSWHRQMSKTTTKTYKANTTYVEWQLYNVIEAKTYYQHRYEYGGNAAQDWSQVPATETNSVLHLPGRGYEDSLADQGRTHLKVAEKLYKKMKKAERRR